MMSSSGPLAQPPINPAAGATAPGGGAGMEELLPLVKQLTNPEQVRPQMDDEMQRNRLSYYRQLVRRQQKRRKAVVYTLLSFLVVRNFERELVLLELSKKRESFPDLAPILWHSVATVAALLQEIVSIYPLLTPPTLTAHASNRVCNALALLQCVASHPDTRQPFLSAQIPLYLYPFLNTQSKTRPFEYLRLTSLGVIGALVKVDDAEVISFLLSTEIIPLCLRIMETGSELSKTVATFIVQKILLEETGLNYVCATAERFFAISTVLGNMVQLLQVHPSVRLLKHVVRCYLRLADHPRAREALKTCLPPSLRDNTFAPHLHNDPTVQKWLTQLLTTVGGEVGGGGGGAESASAQAAFGDAPNQ